MGTKYSIALDCEDLITGLDASAKKFEDFAGKAEKHINDIDNAGTKMNETQKRVFENLTNSYFKHTAAIKKIKNEYEQLRAKQKSGLDLTQSEIAQLRLLDKEYAAHWGQTPLGFLFSLIRLLFLKRHLGFSLDTMLELIYNNS